MNSFRKQVERRREPTLLEAMERLIEKWGKATGQETASLLKLARHVIKE